jgi:hypothetical protein
MRPKTGYGLVKVVPRFVTGGNRFGSNSLCYTSSLRCNRFGLGHTFWSNRLKRSTCYTSWRQNRVIFKPNFFRGRRGTYPSTTSIAGLESVTGSMKSALVTLSGTAQFSSVTLPNALLEAIRQRAEQCFLCARADAGIGPPQRSHVLVGFVAWVSIRGPQTGVQP